MISTHVKLATKALGVLQRLSPRPEMIAINRDWNTSERLNLQPAPTPFYKDWTLLSSGTEQTESILSMNRSISAEKNTIYFRNKLDKTKLTKTSPEMEHFLESAWQNEKIKMMMLSLSDHRLWEKGNWKQGIDLPRRWITCATFTTLSSYFGAENDLGTGKDLGETMDLFPANPVYDA